MLFLSLLLLLSQTFGADDAYQLLEDGNREQPLISEEEKLEEFLAAVKANRDANGNKTVLITRDGRKIPRHVADMFTDFDTATVKKAASWLKNYVMKNRMLCSGFIFGVGVGTKVLGPMVAEKVLQQLENVAQLQFSSRLAVYQALMFARVFVAGVVPGAAVMFTIPIQQIEMDVIKNNGGQGTDYTTLITLAASVGPNLLASIDGFSEFIFRRIYKLPPVAKVIADIMEDAYENAETPEEKAANPISLAHFAFGSGTFASLTAGLFTLNMVDLATSGAFGVSDDLVMNIMLKGMQDPQGGMKNAKYMLGTVQAFQLVDTLNEGQHALFIMHLVNTLLSQFMMNAFEYDYVALFNWTPADLTQFYPMFSLFATSILFPTIYRFVAAQLGYQLPRHHD